LLRNYDYAATSGKYDNTVFLMFPRRTVFPDFAFRRQKGAFCVLKNF